MIRKNLLLFIALSLFQSVIPQKKIIDQVAAIVGTTVILQSEIEQQYLQLTMEGIRGKNLKCLVFEEMLMQKLLLNQAKLDSVEVNPAQVELALEQRLSYFEEMAGSREALLKQFNKTSRIELKDDFRDAVRDMMIIQQMKSDITGNISITPSETKKYFKSLPEDSIPFIDAKIEISQIVVYPYFGDEAIVQLRKKLLDLRKRIVNGEQFSTLAVLYSQGPSAVKGGDIGCMAKGELDPEYAKAAFSLKEGNVSNIVKSKFGYHLIQLYERKENRVCTRHILMRPEITSDAMQKAIVKLDSITQLIRLDSLTFEEAAIKFSDDEKTSANGGLLINDYDMSSYFKIDELPPSDYRIIRNLKIGEISKAYKSVDEASQPVFKVVKVTAKTSPHKATIEQDYSDIQQMALEAKKQDVLNEWLLEKQQDTYIKINKPLCDCELSSDGWIK